MQTLLQDLRYGLRILVKNPAFTAVAVLTLALGIGANTAIFTVVNTVMLRPLPYSDPGRLMVLTESSQRQPHVSVSYPNFFDWRSRNHVFSEMASLQPRDFNLGGVAEPENIGGAVISSNFFRTLGVKPMLGRDFTRDEDKRGAAAVAILDFKLWQRRFGGDPSVLGKTVTLDGKIFSIVGVLSPGLIMYESPEIYTPMGFWMDDEMMERGSHDDTSVVARLKDGATLDEARAEMNTIAAQLDQQYPVTNRGYRVNVTPVREALVGDNGLPIMALFAAVGLVLLIACVNVANLLLARGTARGREFAIRAALGANRAQIVRQLLTEGTLLALISGALGLLFGAWALNGLLTLVPGDISMGSPISIDRWVLAFTLLLSLLTVGIFGLAPAFGASRANLNETLKESGRLASSGLERGRLRGFLVVSEVALALVLLVGAGLLVKSFRRILAVDPGFNSQKVLTMAVTLRGPKYDDTKQVIRFEQQALEQIRSLPGVRFAALGTQLPLTDSHSRSDITIEAQPVPANGDFPHPDFHVISPDYPSAIGLPLLRGRSFTESDTAQAPPAVLISESLARRFWPNGDAVGRRIQLGRPDPKKLWQTVVGIVGDTKQYGLTAATRWEIYQSYLQAPTHNFRFVIRSASKPEDLAAGIAAEIHRLDKDAPLSEIQTMDQWVSNSFGLQRATMVLSGFFALLAAALAGVGIYGVVSFSVGQRSHEIGIRMALGAERADVLRLVLGNGFRLTLLGIGCGVVGALFLARMLTKLLFGVQPTDLTVFGAVSILLMLVSLLAAYIPARRATKVDSMVALRYE